MFQDMLGLVFRDIEMMLFQPKISMELYGVV